MILKLDSSTYRLRNWQLKSAVSKVN